MTWPTDPVFGDRRVALVTGASRGIGKGIATTLAADGYDVAIHFVQDRAGAEAVVAELVSNGGRAAAFAADLTQPAESRRLHEAVTESLGHPAVLVNNAGGMLRRPDLDELTLDDWRWTFALNVDAPFLLAQACIPAMRAASWGRIVNVSSGAAHTGGRGQTGLIAYATAKAGLEGLSRALATRVVSEGITVNSVVPSVIMTERVQDLPEHRARIPMGRIGRVDEIADVVRMLVRNGYMTGQSVSVNGGMYYA